MKRWCAWLFAVLYAAAATVSTVHSVDLFGLTMPKWLAVSTACTFELGAASCLAAALWIKRTSRTLVWSLFGMVTVVQVAANLYSAYHGAHDFGDWSELLGLQDMERSMQRRTLAAVTGGILPLVALGFSRVMVDFLSGEDTPAETRRDVAGDFVTRAEFDQLRADSLGDGAVNPTS